MATFQKFIGMGNISRDPEMSHVGQGNTAVCNFSMAFNESWITAAGERREEVLFLDCVAWKGTGELIMKHLRKGNPVLVEGKLKQDQWEDKEGNRRSKIKLNVDRFTFVGRKADRGPVEEPQNEEQEPQDELGL